MNDRKAQATSQSHDSQSAADTFLRLGKRPRPVRT